MLSIDVYTLVLASQTAMCHQVLMFQRYPIGRWHMDDWYTIVTFQASSGQCSGRSMPHVDAGPVKAAPVQNAILIDEASTDVRSNFMPFGPFRHTLLYIRSPGP